MEQNGCKAQDPLKNKAAFIAKRFSKAVSPGAQYNVLTVLRFLNKESEDISYTGVGFTPNLLIIIYGCEQLLTVGFSIAQNPQSQRSISVLPGERYWTVDWLIAKILDSSGLNGQMGTLKSIDADGFTITWEKQGDTNPYYSAELQVFCLG